MSAIATVLNRMGDVMLALREAKRANVNPTRIQLQKFIYLGDVLSQVIGLLKLQEGHKTYRNGPYDAAIQNAVDALAFRGFAKITGVWNTPSGHLATSYTLTSSGDRFLSLYTAQPILSEKSRLAALVGDQLCRLGWNRIVQLVYAEPTYLASRPSGFGLMLEPEDGLAVSAAFVVSIMRRVSITLLPDKEASVEWIVDRFFAFLSDYDLTHMSSNSPDL